MILSKEKIKYTKGIYYRLVRKTRRFFSRQLFEGYSTFLDRVIFRIFAAVNTIGKALSPKATRDAVYNILLAYLLTELPVYEEPLQTLNGTRVEESLFLVYKKKRFMEAAQPGDVILIRGNQRISRIIQTLTHSAYSHAAIYMGNGDIVESEPGGVLQSSIDRYIHLDIRICRPVMMTEKGKEILLEHVKETLKQQPKYDVKNIENLLFKYIYVKFRPDVQVYIGGTTKFEKYYICSGMIAHGFHKAGYPIVPSLHFRKKRKQPMPTLETISDYFDWVVHSNKNYSHIVPGDFDNSSFFVPVKFLCLDSQPHSRRRAFK
ncbi:hypothetical protein WDW89_15430 [Deltaproteobacteria bacterium TL4]